MSSSRHLAIAIALVYGVARAAETESIGPLMETARLEGQAHGTLGGATAARMAAMGIRQPVEVSVTRLHRLRDPGCARLKVSFDQHNVVLPGETAPRDRHAEFAMNWCEGGRPPSSEDGTRPADDALKKHAGPPQVFLAPHRGAGWAKPGPGGAQMDKK